MRPPHARRAQQRPMGLMKYSSHYVTHSNSLPSESNGWLVDVPAVGGGVRGRLKIGCSLSDSHSSQVILRTSTLIKSPWLDRCTYSPNLWRRKRNIPLTDIVMPLIQSQSFINAILLQVPIWHRIHVLLCKEKLTLKAGILHNHIRV